MAATDAERRGGGVYFGSHLCMKYDFSAILTGAYSYKYHSTFAGQLSRRRKPTSALLAGPRGCRLTPTATAEPTYKSNLALSLTAPALLAINSGASRSIG
jgi:hypothetical protein